MFDLEERKKINGKEIKIKRKKRLINKNYGFYYGLLTLIDNAYACIHIHNIKFMYICDITNDLTVLHLAESLKIENKQK